MIIGVSGHRKLPQDHYNHIYIETEKALRQLKPDKLISGLAIGYDQLAAVIAFRNNIPVIGAIPFIGQENVWPDKAKETYNKIVNKCNNTVIVCNGDYAVWKFMERNKYIVDNSDIILCYFNGSNSGTKNCIDYAKTKNKKIINIYHNDI